MTPENRTSRGILWGLSLVLFAIASWSPETAAAAASTTPAEELPIEDFAELPFVEQATLSPDGTHVAGIFGVQGVQVILVANLLDKTEKKVRVAIPDGNDARWLHWVNNDNVIVGVDALQRIGAKDWYVTRAIGVNRSTGKVTRLLQDLGGQNGGDVIWYPSDDGNEVLISAQNSVFEDEEFWPSVHRVNVTNGHSHEEVKGRVGIMDWGADSSGFVRIGIGYQDTTRTSRLLYRPRAGSDSFRIIDRADARRREHLRVPFMFVRNGDHGLVLHDDERGMSAIYEYDYATQTEIGAIYVPEHGEVGSPIVSRDGSSLLGVSTTAINGGIHWIDPDLAELQKQFDGAVPNSTARIVSMSADRSRMLVRIAAGDAPGSIYYYDVDGSAMHRIAYVNSMIGGRHLAPVSVVTYTARDGLTIEALLTLPAGRTPHNLPLVVMPHGGPWAQDTLEYDYWQQFLANRGYAVLQPNFRGSTGYGTEFLHKGEGQLGLAMQDDITDGVKWSIAQGIADPARVCIVGASYGGYAAMWGIAKDPDLYRCAISIAGVSGLKREVDEFANDVRGGQYGDAWKRMTPDFDAVSPINATARIQAPLLLIHGKKDVTVSSVQSTKMFDRMKKAGKNVDLLLLPLADHYYTRQEDRLALLGAIEKFLAKYDPADQPVKGLSGEAVGMSPIAIAAD